MKKVSSAWNSFPEELLTSERKGDVVPSKGMPLEQEEEADIDENQKLQLQRVSSLVDDAYRKVGLYRQGLEFYKSASAAVSERSSCPSTHQHATSLPESLDGGQVEVEELKSLPPTMDSTLKMNQALQRRFTATLARLQKTLEENLVKQAQLKEEIEEQTLMYCSQATSKELRERYRIRVSNFNIPYFKDRHGIHAPMNEETKIKVENGYIDLYSTKCRTWIQSERRVLAKAVQKQYKETSIKKWALAFKDLERTLKDSSLNEEETDAAKNELEICRNHLELIKNCPLDKLEFHSDIYIDWDQISALVFDGGRSAEECQLQWDNYAHHSINCSNFSQEEDIMIQTLITKDGDKKHDWDAICNSLGTGRTPFQVMSRWASFIRPVLNPARWNDEDSRKLVDTVNMLRIGSHIPWAQVSRHLLGYTPSQMLSRWRVLNPNMIRGVFTKDEDFNLIKGVYMFGLNFDTMTHFLPGRTRDQVKNRFRRTLLPGLSHKPWTLKEDRKIIKYCHIDFNNWRSLAAHIPNRNSCELRVRYYTLHFWQDISDQKIMPPPLFPLSQTTKPEEIRTLRSRIYSCSNTSIRPYLDQIDAKAGPKMTVNFFEEKRIATSNSQKPKKIAKLLQTIKDNRPLPKVKQRRGAKKGPKSTSWPETALVEYFLPHRIPSYKPLPDPYESCWEPYLLLNQTLVLNIQGKASAEEKAYLKDFALSDVDYRLISLISQENKQSGLFSSEGGVTKGPCPDAMPLLPPSGTTLGAFISLLIHLPKLKEMATKKFLLFQVTKNQLPKLGIKPRTLNLCKKKKQVVSHENEVIQKLIPQIDQLSANLKNSQDAGNSKRAAAQKANIVNQVFIKADELLNEAPEDEEGGGEEDDALVEPTEEENEALQLACKVPSVRSSFCADLETAQSAFEKSDQILFHRFMSLFLLPCIFSMKRPPDYCSLKAKTILDNFIHSSAMEEEKEVTDEELTSNITLDNKPGLPTKYGTILPHLDSSEQGELITVLEERLKGQKRRGRVSETLPQDVLKVDEKSSTIAKRLRPNFVCNSKSITSLKRSMIMKKLWEDRRKGLRPGKRKNGEVPPAPVQEGTRKSARKRRKLTQQDFDYDMDNVDDMDSSQ